MSGPTIDPSVVPGLLILAVELLTLALIGFVVSRVLLRQNDSFLALAQGLAVGLRSGALSRASPCS